MEKKRKLIAVAAAIVIVALAATVIVLLTRRSDESAEGGGAIGYATGVTIIDDSEAMQAAVDEAIGKMGTIAVSYQGEAFSSDGRTFSCYIANPDYNEYDMYIGIYASEDMKDELFLSGLIRPGEAFEELTLKRELEKGSRECLLTMTQVSDDHETIVGQALLSITLTVE